MTTNIAEAARLLAGSSRVLVVTGAGISRASGLPTYRGVGGLYTGSSLLPPELTLSAPCLRRMPSLTWKTFRQAFERAQGVEPNVAHDAVVAMNAMSHVTVLTQNVDGLHRDAGSDDVIEIHGSARTFSCDAGCGHSVNEMPEGRVPQCPDCGAIVRPDVVLFGEDLPDEAVNRLTRVLLEGVDLVIAVGTTASFPYIRDAITESQGGVIFIDPMPGDFARDAADVLIKAPAEEALPSIVNLAWAILSQERSDPS